MGRDRELNAFANELGLTAPGLAGKLLERAL
jgi:hypothetical protein